MLEFKTPSLGADMDAGLLVAWNKRPGDRVRRGDLIAEVETDKEIIEVFADGVLEKLMTPVGEKVPVGIYEWPIVTIAGLVIASRHGSLDCANESTRLWSPRRLNHSAAESSTRSDLTTCAPTATPPLAYCPMPTPPKAV